MTQEYPTNWNVDKYFDETEPEEHWNLRKRFMEVHQGKFPEDYLVALAKTFTNIEFLGCMYVSVNIKQFVWNLLLVSKCRYPAPLMTRIAELSKDVAKEYREIKKTKLQRTFVTASNAAENKATSKFYTVYLKIYDKNNIFK